MTDYTVKMTARKANQPVQVVGVVVAAENKGKNYGGPTASSLGGAMIATSGWKSVNARRAAVTRVTGCRISSSAIGVQEV